MNNPMSRARAALLAAPLCVGTLGAAPVVAAAEAGFYVGGYYGETRRDGETTFFERYGQAFYDFVGFTPSQITSRRDTRDSAFGFTAGYRLTQYIAFEGGYMDLGTLAYRAESPGVFSDGFPETLTLHADSKLSGIAASALAILPLGRSLELYARGGVLFATNKVEAFLTDGEGVLPDEFSETSTDFLVGAGVSLSFLEIYALRLEYQRVLDAGKANAGGGEDIDLVSVGITVAF